MELSVNVLDFDHGYNTQNYFKKADYEVINLSDIRSTNRYCERKSLIAIKDRLKKRKSRGITFIGSGNYHYVTYLLISEVKEPFTLVLFDHHTDMMNSPCDSIVTCGSWVLKSLENLQMLKKVVIIGIEDKLQNSIPEQLNKTVAVFSEKKLGQANIKQYIKSAISTNNVYFSIDKDVLQESEAVTNWDQGTMKLKELINIISYISVNKRICGTDICGEYSYNPVSSFCEEGIDAIRKNDRANLTILNTIKELA